MQARSGRARTEGIALVDGEYRWNDSLVSAAPLRVPQARETIRSANVASGRRLLVIDDDPTGSQTVHDVDAVLAVDPETIAQSLDTPGSTCFVLTNSRSVDERAAYAMSLHLGTLAMDLERQTGGLVEVVSRSDSTLRGHLRAEIAALVEARAAAGEPAYDGILLIPSYFEAGRYTAGDIHWARVAGVPVAVGETEFARDKTFGFANSELPRFVEEKYAGDTRASDVCTLSLEDIRIGGPDRIAARLTGLPRESGTYVVVNAVDYADLDVVVLGLQLAEAAGRSFLFRSGPSFVQSLAGLPHRPPLTSESARPQPRSGHGLVVVGSHVGLTTRQVAQLLSADDISPVVLDAEQLVGDQADKTVAMAVDEVIRGLADRDVVLMTSRELVAGPDAASSLDIARAVSAGLVDVVEQVARHPLPWVIAKGGITSHDVLANALHIRRARVLGQLFAGFVSVFLPVDAPPEILGTPCVVFAGNVGDERSLRTAVEVMRG